jgi:hypothetical protein
MKKKENISEMTVDQLKEMNGGGFAYDLGRILRFIGLSGGGHPGALAYAVTDWEVNAMISEDAND